MAPHVAVIDLTSDQPIDQPIPKRLPKAGRIAREHQRQEELHQGIEEAEALLAEEEDENEKEALLAEARQQQEFEAWHAERQSRQSHHSRHSQTASTVVLSRSEAQNVLQRMAVAEAARRTLETQLADLQEQINVHKRMLDLWSSLHDHARSRRRRRRSR